MAKRKMAGRKPVVKKAAKKPAKNAGRRGHLFPGGMSSKRGAAKAAPKKAAAKKAATSRKAVAKKAGPKKAAARKAATKKAAPRKAALKKAAPKKAPPKKAAARKIPVRRAGPVVKKPARVVGPIAKAAPKRAARKGSGPARAGNTAPIRGAIPSSLGMAGGSSSSARTGREELLQHIKEHNETSPAITAGDVDADWQLAYSSGDEAPGGDNPTPDQDVVDEIGEALGVNYDDGEELKGAAKIEDRDKHRWELDPASKDDFDDQ
jgi:Family of unknown function (DUF6335)